MDSHAVEEKPSNPQKCKKKKKEIRLKNIDIPQNFRSSVFPEHNSDELQITRVLDYSERDFPELGCKAVTNRKNRNVVKYSERGASIFIDHRDSGHQNWKLSEKVLKSNKHKEAFKIQFEEIFSNSSNKLIRKQRIRLVKHYQEKISLGSNPLDSDNPIRQKGVTSSKPKVKRISKTKAVVFKAREDKQRFKEIAENIYIKDNIVQIDKDFLVDELWKPICLVKTNDLRKSLQKQISPKDGDSKNVQLPPPSLDNINITNEDLVNNSLEENKARSECSSDSLPSERTQNISTVPLEEILKDSEIPPYKLLIHNNNFKRYCDNCITSELNEITEKLISQLVRYQYKKYQIDPIKATAKKRYVLGLRQVKKFTKLNKTKLIIFVPNMEESLFEVVEELKSLAVAYCIPYLFAFSRKKLGKLAYKKIGVSCLGILDYCGAEENFTKCIEVLTILKKVYNEKCRDAKDHYEQHFGAGPVTITNSINEENEEICSDFVSKLSLSDKSNGPSNFEDLNLMMSKNA